MASMKVAKNSILSFFRRHPVLKTMAAYLTVGTCADLNEQTFVSKKDNYDTARTLRIATVYTFVSGPLVYNWIRFIERRFVGTALLTAFKKVLLEQMVFAPTAISCFYISTNVLEAKKDLLAEWKQKFLPTFTTGLAFWPAAQLINYKCVPVAYKSCLYMPCCSFMWTTFLCYMKNKKTETLKSEENSPTAQEPVRALTDMVKSGGDTVLTATRLPELSSMAQTFSDAHSEWTAERHTLLLS